jgi:hypothetical protein
MLTPRQEQTVRFNSRRAYDVNQYEAYVTDAVCGRYNLTDGEVRAIIDEALAVARLPYPHRRFRNNFFT